MNVEIVLQTKNIPKFILDINSTPQNATVFIDDEETTFKTPIKIQDIEVNKKHTVGLYLDGYLFWSKEFKANPNQTQNFDIQLVKNFGSLSIESRPKDALVVINGAPAGKTPLTLDKFQRGKD